MYVHSKWTSIDGSVIIDKKYHSARVMPFAPKVKERRSPRTGEATPERQAEINRKRKAEKLKMELLDNFRKGDLYLTCTYSDKPDTKLVPADFAAFKRRIARIYKRLGKVFKYIAVLENLKGKGRAHIHMLIPGADREAVEQIENSWSKGQMKIEFYKGELIDATKLSDYFCKEKIAEHSGRLRKSHNLIRREPKRTIAIADTFSDDIKAPKGYHVVKEFSYQGETADGYPLIVAVYERDRDTGKGRKHGKAETGPAGRRRQMAAAGRV